MAQTEEGKALKESIARSLKEVETWKKEIDKKKGTAEDHRTNCDRCKGEADHNSASAANKALEANKKFVDRGSPEEADRVAAERLKETKEFRNLAEKSKEEVVNEISPGVRSLSTE